MEIVEFSGFKVAIDPETNFWAIYEEILPEEILKFHEENSKALTERMKKYRFEVNFNTAYINPTERCNANCPYCYIPPEIRNRGREMDYGTLKDILERLETLGVRNVIFHGAEPLIVKNEIFRAIDEFDYRFGVQTNGFLLESQDVEFLVERGVNVGLSFDSPRQEVDDLLRGKGHHRKIVELLDTFNGYENLNIITTINRHNYTHLAEMVDFLAGKVRLVLMNPVRGTSEGGRALRPDPLEAAGHFIEAVERAIWHTKNGKRIVIGDFANVLLGIIAPYSRVLQCDISPCGGGRRFISITPDGIFPCGEFIGMEQFRTGLEDLENVKNHFQEVKNRTVENIEECRECVYRNICGAPCPAEVYAETGTMLEKSPFCEFYKKVIEHAFRVIHRRDVEHVINLRGLRKIYEIEFGK
ncbi:peptide-modifying radical SAM enzyme CbpB [Geoglobus acetivorans]|uniref:Peptide-modifying radical SAM enzyme CbpB n=1 Tax=Geoglobus acetivorans TaxID=565033 RepID=A0ABZ3H3A7_GEOAI|nr:peptide-modifying radical SAM enzyme CbpB [Geoglobus acetivorans]